MARLQARLAGQALQASPGVEGAGTTVSAISQARPGGKAADSGQPAKNTSKAGISGGTVTARRTLVSTTSRIYPTLAARQRKLRDASPVRRSPTRASEHDQSSFDDRASCHAQQRPH